MDQMVRIWMLGLNTALERVSSTAPKFEHWTETRDYLNTCPYWASHIARRGPDDARKEAVRILNEIVTILHVHEKEEELKNQLIGSIAELEKSMETASKPENKENKNMSDSEVIRLSVAVHVKKGDAEKVARDFREAGAAEKLQMYAANILGPNVVGDAVDLDVMDKEHVVHACDIYSEGECSVCRRTGSESLRRVNSRL